MTEKKDDIVIIGAGLTGLALAYFLKQQGRNVLIIEKKGRTGGVIHSVTENGFTYETGPSTGVVGTLEIAELFEELSGECKLEIAEESAQKRYILKNGKWHLLPAGLFSAIGTPLFSWYDKFRILGEPFRKAGTDPNESVGEIVKRRLGKSYLDYAVDPFISGVYAGDPDRLITRFALPKLYNLEQKYGSFIKGSIKKAKEPKPYGAEKISRKVFSIEGGLSNMIRALTDKVGDKHIRLNCSHTKVEPLETGYTVSFTNSANETESIVTPCVVSTVGGYALSEIFSFIPNKLILPIKKVRYADVVQATVAFGTWNAPSLEGFGGLVPRIENRSILGVLYPSVIFRNRAPKGGALLSVFMGGSRNLKMLQKRDDELYEIIIREIRSTLGKQLTPDFIKIYRHKNAIVQYDDVSEEKMKAIGEIEQKYRGVYLAGSIRDGIGMADRVKQAKYLANLITQT